MIDECHRCSSMRPSSSTLIRHRVEDVSRDRSARTSLYALRVLQRRVGAPILAAVDAASTDPETDSRAPLSKAQRAAKTGWRDPGTWAVLGALLGAVTVAAWAMLVYTPPPNGVGSLHSGRKCDGSLLSGDRFPDGHHRGETDRPRRRRSAGRLHRRQSRSRWDLFRSGTDQWHRDGWDGGPVGDERPRRRKGAIYSVNNDARSFSNWPDGGETGARLTESGRWRRCRSGLRGRLRPSQWRARTSPASPAMAPDPFGPRDFWRTSLRPASRAADVARRLIRVQHLVQGIPLAAAAVGELAAGIPGGPSLTLGVSQVPKSRQDHWLAIPMRLEVLRCGHYVGVRGPGACKLWVPDTGCRAREAQHPWLGNRAGSALSCALRLGAALPIVAGC